MSSELKILLGYQTVNESTTIDLDYANNKVLLNNKPVNMDAKKLCQLVAGIVSSWDSKMIDKNTVDGVEYFVKIQKGKKVYSYEGANQFPNNFNDFLTLIREVKKYGSKV